MDAMKNINFQASFVARHKHFKGIKHYILFVLHLSSNIYIRPLFSKITDWKLNVCKVISTCPSFLALSSHSSILLQTKSSVNDISPFASSHRSKACIDFTPLLLQGRCNREKPPCKYFHPPQHLKDQLLINGRNHLALKNALIQQMGYMSQPFLAGQFPASMVRALK